MPWSWTPKRSLEIELMDFPGLPEQEVVEAYRILRRVNRLFGNLASMRREVERMLVEDSFRTREHVLTILDIGSGSGDIPRDLMEQLGKRKQAAWICALDRDHRAVLLARESGLHVLLGDALRLPFEDGSLDMVTAVKFAHHFSGKPLLQLVAEMARVAKHRVLILDIRRHWMAYCGFFVWSRVFTRNRLVRHDGSLSILRGFTASELAGLSETVRDFEWRVRGYPGFQLALVGRRITS